MRNRAHGRQSRSAAGFFTLRKRSLSLFCLTHTCTLFSLAYFPALRLAGLRTGELVP